MGRRRATTDDIERATDIVTLAFATDPVWEVALRRVDGRVEHHRPYWRLFVAGATRFGTVFMRDDGVAVSVWLPPGATELDDTGGVALDQLLERSLDPDTSVAMAELFGRFEASRARRFDHAYLSLLATHPDHRGRGEGQALLADDLVHWDAQRVPTYLESTNPANDHRYARAGFREDGGFHAVRDDAWVSAMWRPVDGTPPEAAYG